MSAKLDDDTHMNDLLLLTCSSIFRSARIEGIVSNLRVDGEDFAEDFKNKKHANY